HDRRRRARAGSAMRHPRSTKGTVTPQPASRRRDSASPGDAPGAPDAPPAPPFRAPPARPREAPQGRLPAREAMETAPFGTLLAPITLQTAGERIAERFVTAIALGEFVPGQRLPPERELAAMLEVSRTTVREALQRLQAAGYVTARRGRRGGTFVRTGQGPGPDEMIRRTLVPAWAQLTELLDFRQLVEQLIARTAAVRRQ